MFQILRIRKIKEDLIRSLFNTKVVYRHKIILIAYTNIIAILNACIAKRLPKAESNHILAVDLVLKEDGVIFGID